MNFMDRKVCRRCQAQSARANAPKQDPSKHVVRPTPKAASSQQPAFAPWASREMVEAREASLTTALEAAKVCHGCDSAVKNIESQLKGLRKRIAEPPSVHKNIDSTRAFIGRAEGRHQQLVDEVAAAQLLERAAFQELSEARERLQLMEAEAREALAVPPPPSANLAQLTDAVRTLMVTIHKCDLLPDVGEAILMVSH